MADTSILSDFGINILEEEIDDVIFQTNEFPRKFLVDIADEHGTRRTLLHHCSGWYGLQDDGEARTA